LQRHSSGGALDNIFEIGCTCSALDLLILGLVSKTPKLSGRPKIDYVRGSVGKKVVLGSHAAFKLRNLLVQAAVLGNGSIKSYDALKGKGFSDIQLDHLDEC
jgi:hypothetical protein